MKWNLNLWIACIIFTGCTSAKLVKNPLPEQVAGVEGRDYHDHLDALFLTRNYFITDALLAKVSINDCQTDEAHIYRCTIAQGTPTSTAFIAERAPASEQHVSSLADECHGVNFTTSFRGVEIQFYSLHPSQCLAELAPEIKSWRTSWPDLFQVKSPVHR